MAVVNLTVTVEKLRQKAKEVSDTVSRIRRDYNKLSSAMNGTRSYWTGESGDLHRRLYNERMEEINEILDLLEAYPTDLMKSAGIYEQAETANQEAAAALSSNVIF